MTTNSQDFGSNPIEVRDTDHYQEEYVTDFVDCWDALIDWDRRTDSEGDFFIRLLKENGCKRVLDVATGTGFHSVRLLQEGFDVTSADGSPAMLTKAFENARKSGFVLRTIHADWRWLTKDIHAKYDAIICLGNSLTHLFDESDRRKALAEFYSVLNHDGILILDQRNYDSIMDEGYDSTHKYYYCGEEVVAEPEHVDEGLARFRYAFKNGKVFHLNMFPLRKDYLTSLMKEVGFQEVQTFGDFKETYKETDPDFYIHVAHKHSESPEEEDDRDVTTVTKDYYDSSDADNFYFNFWGGEDIHIGTYKDDKEPVFEASRRTVEKMLGKLEGINPKTRILDIGAGYGGSARYIAEKTGCHVSCLNLSPVQNQRNRDMNSGRDLGLTINVVDGSFEAVPAPDESFDVVWSQDAILHSSHRAKVFAEVNRVLAPNGQFIFTDPMASPDVPKKDLQPILDRIHLDSLGSVEYYRDLAEDLGWEELGWEDLSSYLPIHYFRLHKELERRAAEASRLISQDYIERMKKGLMHWVDGGNNGNLQWGILHFRKK